MVALCPLKSLRCCPQGPTKHPHEVPNPPGNAHGCAMDPTLDTHDGQTQKEGQDTSWKRPGAPPLLLESLPWARWPPGPGAALLATP